jgi:Putative DNA-binding domain
MLLRDMQAAFAAVITGEGMDALAPHIVSNGMAAEQRVAVYRNNVHHNRREALRAVYPVVERLVDTRFFDYAADRYIAVCASACGDIHRYGGSFAEFLSGFAPAAQLAYLPDTARLEWAMHEVFHAADHAPLALDRLGRLPPASHAALGFMLHPACRLLSSPFPVHRIWEWNQPDAQQEGELDIGGASATLLVRRSGYAVELLPLATAEFVMLKALSEGQPVAAAYDGAVRADNSFELAPFILRHVSLQTLVDFHVVQADSRQEPQ